MSPSQLNFQHTHREFVIYFFNTVCYLALVILNKSLTFSVFAKICLEFRKFVAIKNIGSILWITTAEIANDENLPQNLQTITNFSMKATLIWNSTSETL